MCECEVCSLEPEERARNDARRGAALLLLQQFLASAQAGDHLTEVLNKAAVTSPNLSIAFVRFCF